MLTILTGLCAGVILAYLFPIVKVCGNSMYPTFSEGDIIITSRIYKKPELGSVYIYESPYEKGRFVIKRLHCISRAGFYFLGDNPDDSYDSRHYGAVRGSNIKCKYITTLRKVNKNNGKDY